MNCLSWNCRGIGGSRTVHDLVTLSQIYQPQFIFLCETRQNKDKVSRLRYQLGLHGFAGVSSGGLSGGLALFWNDQLCVDFKEINERYIDVFVRVLPSEPMWRMTCVYGEPRTENSHLMWSKLRELKAKYDLPWIILGDFNEALWQQEHLSCTPRSESHMMAFREVLNVCDMVDLGFSGVPYTYDNRRAGRKNVRVRLDRAGADNAWRDLYSEASVKHLISPCSDHCPFLVTMAWEERTQNKRRCRQYELFWERASELSKIIANAWEEAGAGGDLHSVQASLGKVMNGLHNWSKRKFGNVLRELELVRAELEGLMQSGADQREIRRVTDHMNELLYKEEMIWL